MWRIYCKQICNRKVDIAFHMKTIYMTLKEFRKPITNKNNYLLHNNPDLSMGQGTGA